MSKVYNKKFENSGPIGIVRDPDHFTINRSVEENGRNWDGGQNESNRQKKGKQKGR